MSQVEMAFDEAMRSARADIRRATKANDIMIEAVALAMQDDPEISREQHIATLVMQIDRIAHDDLLVMWAVLIMARTEVAKLAA